MWPPVRKGIGETCSELSSDVNTPVLPSWLERRNVIMHKVSGERGGGGGGCLPAAQI